MQEFATLREAKEFAAAWWGANAHPVEWARYLTEVIGPDAQARAMLAAALGGDEVALRALQDRFEETGLPNLHWEGIRRELEGVGVLPPRRREPRPGRLLGTMVRVPAG